MDAFCSTLCGMDRSAALTMVGRIERRSGRRRFSLAVEATFHNPVSSVSGSSGSGKTALLRAIAGLEAFEGSLTWHEPTKEAYDPMRHAVYLPADGTAAFYPDMPLALQLADFLDRAPQKEAAPLLAALDLPDDLRRPPRTLSGGEAQRMSYVFAVLRRPAILLIDEPCSAVESSRRSSYLSALFAHLRGTRIVYASHDSQVQNLAGQRFRVCEGGDGGFLVENRLEELAT